MKNNECLGTYTRLKERIPFDSKLIEMRKLKKACSEAGTTINQYLSPCDKENLYVSAWIKVAVYSSFVTTPVIEFVSMLDYTPTPDVMGWVFSKRYTDHGISCALIYLYSELIGKVFPVSADLASFLANRFELITWNGTSVTVDGALKLIRETSHVYLVGSKDIEELVSFMSFIPVAE